MTIGMPTLVEFDTILENVEFAKKNHLDFIELNMDLPYCQAMDHLSDYSILFTMHLSEEIHIADLNERLRKAYLEEAIREITLGIKNGIKRYTIHFDSGVYFTLPEGKTFLNEKYLVLYQSHFEDSCRKLEKLAEENDLMINFENTKIHSFIQSAVDIVHKYPHLGFTLDIGHNEKDGDQAYPLFYQTGKIRHIHMHDTDGKKDHLAIGPGNVDFTKYKDLFQDNYVVLEVKKSEDLQLSVQNIKEF